MSYIFAIFLFLSLSSCSFLLSPPVVAIEEQLALQVLEFVEDEIQGDLEKVKTVPEKNISK